MNEHLRPVFEILLPTLETEGIQYWVYGGVGIAALAGGFFRHNTDVDIFVRDTDFDRARLRLEGKSTEIHFTWKASALRWKDDMLRRERPKFEVFDRSKRQILSVVPVYPKDGVVELVFGGRPTPYSDQILARIPRNICGYGFFTPPDRYIEQLFKAYLEHKGWRKMQKDVNVIYTPDKLLELLGKGE